MIVDGEKPGRTPTWWVYVTYLMTMTLTAFWAGLISRFVPTQLGGWVALGAAVMAAAAFAVFAVRDASFSPDSPYFQALIRSQPAMADPKSRALAAAAFGFFVTFVGVEKGVLEWWTLARGAPGERIFTVTSWSRAGRRSIADCDGYTLRETPPFIDHAICTRDTNVPKTPGLRVLLSGVTSPVGIEPSRFDILP